MLNEFKNWLVRNYNSDQTVNNYYKKVCEYFDFCNNNVNQETLNNYFNHINEKGLSNSFHNLFINSFKRYMEFSKLELELPKFKKIKSQQAVKDYITLDKLNDEIMPMLSLLFRDYRKIEVVLMALFFTGMRSSEICNLKREDINFEDKYFKVMKSKSKVRKIPFLSTEFEKKMKEFFKNYDEESNAFNITKKYLEMNLYKIKKECNLNIKLTPHVFRRSFARYAHHIGWSVSDIRYMLGHSTLKQTEEYIQTDENSVLQKAELMRR